MVYTNLNPPKPETENIDTQDVACLDTTSLTSVVDFMLKFQNDATFTPPTRDVMYDTEKYDISVDDEDVPEAWSELEDLLSEDEMNARAN